MRIPRANNSTKHKLLHYSMSTDWLYKSNNFFIFNFIEKMYSL